MTKVLGCHSNYYITLHIKGKTRQHSSDNRHRVSYIVRYNIGIRYALGILLVFEEEICHVLNAYGSGKVA